MPPPFPPPPGDEGCTPGFWRNHLEDWPPTGFDPGDDFDTTFGVDLFDPDITLEQAVNAKGGGVKKLARHGATALLSAAHPDVAYPLTVDQVIALVQAGASDTLAAFNELGCSIDERSREIPARATATGSWAPRRAVSGPEAKKKCFCGSRLVAQEVTQIVSGRGQSW